MYTGLLHYVYVYMRVSTMSTTPVKGFGIIVNSVIGNNVCYNNSTRDSISNKYNHRLDWILVRFVFHVYLVLSVIVVTEFYNICLSVLGVGLKSLLLGHKYCR